MWRLSDVLAEEFSRTLEETRKAIEEVVDGIKDKWVWKELPEPTKCKAYGVDGSRGVERRSGVIVYAVSGVAVGDDVIEMHDVTTVKTYKHVDERIRLHMGLMELRAGAMVEDADLILMDGTLSGDVIRPPAYASSDGTYERLTDTYDLDNLIQDFVEVLNDCWWNELEKDIKAGRVQRQTLLSRSPYFDKFEKGYKVGAEGDADNLRVLLEYIEHLHALDRLLAKENVVSVAKTFYTSELTDLPGLTDAPILDMLAVEQFGEEKVAYIPFDYRKIDKRIPEIAKRFKNIRSIFDRLNAAFIRFTDYGNIYLVEANRKIDDELVSMLLGLEGDGYLIPLALAHEFAKIKRDKLKEIISTLIRAAIVNNPSYRHLLKYGRGPLEGDS